jgi:sulfate transport system permease protein
MSAVLAWAGPRRSVLPGFGPAMGYTLFYLSLIVLIPLAALAIKSSTLSWPAFWSTVTEPRVLASYRLTFGASLIAALVNLVAGVVVAWVLVRYDFFGKRLVDALIDLPFALPTAVAGIALTALYAPNGWLGEPLAALGVKVAFTPLGVLIALIFIGLPFVVRTVQPVLEDLDRELEGRRLTRRLALAGLLQGCAAMCCPPLDGLRALAGARIGEYGSVISSPATCRSSRRSRRC